MTRLAVLALLVPAAALANPKPLPSTYGYATTPAGDMEIEQYVDLIPVRVTRELPTGDLEEISTLRFDLQTEFEVGVTDRLELAFYLAASQPGADSPQLKLEGIKQRMRYRFAEAGQWPVDVGIYLEIAELFDELELEQKILLSRRFGKLMVAANLWIEQEYVYAEKEWELAYHPTLGATYEVHPSVSVGLEYWMQGEFEGETPVMYLGPTLLLQKGEYWLATAAYVRLDDAPSTGDPFGRFWLRFIVGIGL